MDSTARLLQLEVWLYRYKLCDLEAVITCLGSTLWTQGSILRVILLFTRNADPVCT